MSLPRLDCRCALFLDVDGTLLHIAPRPQDVRVDDALIGLLEKLHAALGGALALVSGRPLREVDALIAPLLLPASGQHGVERRDALGNLHEHGQPAPPAAGRRLAAFASAHPGLILEDKGASLALHYRLVPELAGFVQAEMGDLALELGRDWQALPGKMVCELKPAALDKGSSVCQFMAEPPFRGRLPVFVGDDVTDEYGFEAVNRIGGCSIKVGPGETCAQLFLPGVDAVHAWLASAGSTPDPG
jgi:trehalose 6-phosphate phosphatase